MYSTLTSTHVGVILTWSKEVILCLSSQLDAVTEQNPEMSQSKIQLLRKLHNLCSEQDRPEPNTNIYLTVLDNVSVLQIVENVLRYVPRHPVQTTF